MPSNENNNNNNTKQKQHQAKTKPFRNCLIASQGHSPGRVRSWRCRCRKGSCRLLILRWSKGNVAEFCLSGACEGWCSPLWWPGWNFDFETNTLKRFMNCRCPLLQAPGGHNVIAGIFDGIKAWNKVGPWDGERCIYCYLKAICSSSHLGLSQSSLHVESVILLVWHIFYPIALVECISTRHHSPT